MASSAGGGGSAVSVLAPNGRRHTVKVTPSTVLMQVLEDTCRRQDFDPNEYDLKFQRSVLDLSLQWRFANLPNNAKLEMVPASRSREGLGNMVRIAVQMDDGTRLQDAFCAGQTLWELLSHFPRTRTCLEQLGEATPVCVYMRDEVAGTAALQGTTLQSLGLTGGSAIIRFVVKLSDSASRPEARSRRPGSPTLSVSADHDAGHSVLPLDTGGLSRGDLSRVEHAGPSEARSADGWGPEPTGPPVQWDSKLSSPAAFVPFSGGGQRLGGSSGPAHPMMSSFAKSPKSSSPGGPSQPKKSKPGPGSLPEFEQPVDRDPVVYHPDLEDTLQAWPVELPDEFFEVTVDDVRRRLAQLRSERKRLEEAPLVTRSYREAQMKEKLERYPKVALRVLFPDRYILQGFFRPSETVGDLRDFVKRHLGNSELDFYLFIAPPKTVLGDDTLTLFQANLFPAALVHLGTEESTEVYLEPRLLEHAMSPSSADMLVTRCMARPTAGPPSLPAPDPGPTECEQTTEDALGPPESTPEPNQSMQRNLGPVPKWLKLPVGDRRLPSLLSNDYFPAAACGRGPPT
ncbi:PREDICTED: tether containing UBX domain for GLUT4 [Elephantulus edwardii]|uniref:tether containing UBX domain for GLUT4 n=1 Tax=Elephantulus edwardii TaxID=28737 RepID=UPI0003F0A597|nr:PREDICTED: tether containing UBX domain for GLUT4 [Elephantulus edwardii]